MRGTRSPDLQPAEEEEDSDSDQDLNITVVGCEEAGTSLPCLCSRSSLSRLLASSGPSLLHLSLARGRLHGLSGSIWSVQPVRRLRGIQ
jgi:hypothetical protein